MSEIKINSQRDSLGNGNGISDEQEIYERQNPVYAILGINKIIIMIEVVLKAVTWLVLIIVLFCDIKHMHEVMHQVLSDHFVNAQNKEIIQTILVMYGLGFVGVMGAMVAVLRLRILSVRS